MKQHRVLIFAGASWAAFLVTLVVLYAPPLVVLYAARKSQVNIDNYGRLQIGMTLAEAESILGGAARDESTGPLVLSLVGSELRRDRGLVRVLKTPNPGVHIWVSDEFIIRVYLDENGLVEGKEGASIHRVDK